MLETAGTSLKGIRGMEQQDFDGIEILQGMFPYQQGMQQRFPGKTLQDTKPFPIGSIYVFYLVYGRFYNLTNFGTNTEIEEVNIPPITLPALPPFGNTWFDDFSGYDVGTISRLWGAGPWAIGIGVCETIIEGMIDPYLALDSGFNYLQQIPTEQQPIPAPPVDTPPTTPILPPSGPQNPTECADLPDQDYINLVFGTVITAMQREGGAADTGEVASGEFDPPPPYIPHPYDNEAGSGVQAQENAIRQHYNNGFAWVTRSRSSGYRSSVTWDLTAYADSLPIDAQIFLVGTKQLSDGTGGLFPNLVTTCASLQISTVGEMSGTTIVSTTMGVDTDAIANEGILAYTEVRVYSASY